MLSLKRKSERASFFKKKDRKRSKLVHVQAFDSKPPNVRVKPSRPEEEDEVDYAPVSHSFKRQLIDEVDMGPKVSRKEVNRQPYNGTSDESRKKFYEINNLLDQKVYPITKSGYKYVSIGVDPKLMNTPVLKIVQRNYNTSVTFNVNEFKQFLKNIDFLMEKLSDKNAYKNQSTNYDKEKGSGHIEEENEDEVLLDVASYTVVLYRGNMIQFKENSNSPYSMTITKDTLQMIKYLSETFLYALTELDCKVRKIGYPIYDFLIDNVASIQNDSMTFDEAILEAIHVYYKDASVFFELYTKFYYTIKIDVLRKKEFNLEPINSF